MNVNARMENDKTEADDKKDAMIKKLQNKSPGKINVKRNFLIAQMGQETFKSMIG